MLEFVIILLAAAVLFAFKTIKIVPQQNAWVVERLGKYHATLEPGLNIVIPFIDRVAYKHSLMEYSEDVESQVCITNDNTQVTIDGVLYYQVTDAKKASYGSADYLSAITQLAQTTLRSECGTRDLDKLLGDRAAINIAVVSELDKASATWGVKVLRYEVKDVAPPQAVLHAMQAQITAEREKRALIAASEGRKQEQINIATGEREAFIQRSEGEKQAAINAAQGEAEAIKAVAMATAEAIERVAKATKAEGGLEAMNLKVAEQYISAFGNLAKEGTTLLLPADTGDVGKMVATAMSVLKAAK